MTVALTRTGDGGVRLTVQDGSLAIPRMREYGAEATTGRGLRLVQDLSRSWGVEQSGAGKVIWAELVPEGGGSGDRASATVDEDVALDALLSMFADSGEDPAAHPRSDSPTVAQVLAVVS